MPYSQLVLFTKCLVLAEAMAAVTGLITWRKWKDSYLKWVPVYLAAITILETGYHIFAWYKQDAVSGALYEIAVSFEILFITWFFYKTLNNKNRTLAIAGAAVYIAALIAEQLLLPGHAWYFQSLSYTTGNLFILIYLILFFIELVRSEKILVFKKSVVFWIACGLLIFYLGSFPFYGLYNELSKDLSLFVSIAWIAESLNYCMYLFFTIGFIWAKVN